MDPIEDLYKNLNDKKLLTNENYSLDEFRSWINSDPTSSKYLYDKLTEKKALTNTNYSFDEFNSWLTGSKFQGQSVEPLTNVKDTPDKSVMKPIEGIVPQDIAKMSKEERLKKVEESNGGDIFTIQQRNLKKKELIEGDKYNVEDVTTDELDQVLDGDKNTRLKELADNTTVWDKLKYVGSSILNKINPFNPQTQLNAPVIAAEIALEANNIKDKAKRDIEISKLSEHDTLLEKRVNFLMDKLGEKDSLKYFRDLNEKLHRGQELSQEEATFYNDQLDALQQYPEASNFLQALDKQIELKDKRKEIQNEYKDVYIIDKIKHEKQLAFDNESKDKSGLWYGLYNVGSLINAVPNQLGKHIYDSAMAFDPEASNLIGSDWDKDYWQKTTEQSRPSSEELADVNYNGVDYQVAFDESRRPYAIYRDGFEAQLGEGQFGEILDKLSQVNPNYETRKVTNYTALRSQGFQAITDLAGTLLLTSGVGLAGKAIEGFKATSALGRAIQSTNALTMIPIMSQYMGTYAQQAIKEGGITDPDKILAYAIGGSFIEALTERFNPLETNIVRRGLGLGKFNREMLDMVSTGQLPGFIRKTGKNIANLAGDIAKETLEEYGSNVGQFGLNEIFNKYYESGFVNENPVSIDTLRDTAFITAMATTLPAGIHLMQNTHKSEYIKKAFDAAFRSPDVVDAVVKHRLEKATPEEAVEINKFYDLFKSSKDKSVAFTEGDLKGTPRDIKQEVLARNFEISRLEKNQDDISKKKVEQLQLEVDEITLKSKYGIHDNVLSEIPLDKKSDVLFKVEEVLANTDLSKMSLKTKSKVYSNAVKEALGEKVEDVKDDINKDAINFFNAEITQRIKDQREKYTLAEIRDNLLGAEDLSDFKLSKNAKELYINKAIKDRGIFEEKEILRKNSEELKRKKDIINSVHSKLDFNDKVSFNGIDYNYQTIDSNKNPVLIDSEGNRLQIDGNDITFEQLKDGIDKSVFPITKKPKSPVPPTGNTGNTNIPIEDDTVSDIHDSPDFTDIARGNKGGSTQGLGEKPVIAEDLDSDIQSEWYNAHASEGSYDRIAFLGKEYTETVITDEINSIQRIDINSQVTSSGREFLTGNYQPGVEIKAKVVDDDSILIYDPTVLGVEEISWGELKGYFKGKSFITTPSGLKLTYNDLVPIDLYTGKRIPGNIHTVAWVDKNANEETKQDEIHALRVLRESIINGNTDLVISSFDLGPFNLGQSKVIPSDLTTVVFRKGEPIIGKSKATTYNGEVPADGITYVNTANGLIPINRDILSDDEVNSLSIFINQVFGEQDNAKVAALKDKGIDLTNIDHVERFIDSYVKVEKPIGTNFNKVMATKAEEYLDKNKYIGFEVNKEKKTDGFDLGFSLLIGETHGDKPTYTVYKVTKYKGNSIVQQLIDGEFKTIHNDLEKFSKYMPKLLVSKRINHTISNNFHLITENNIETTPYDDYIQGRLVSSIQFNKLDNGYTAYFQPQIGLIPKGAKAKPASTKVNSTTSSASDLFEVQRKEYNDRVELIKKNGAPEDQARKIAWKETGKTDKAAAIALHLSNTKGLNINAALDEAKKIVENDPAFNPFDESVNKARGASTVLTPEAEKSEIEKERQEELNKLPFAVTLEEAEKNNKKAEIINARYDAKLKVVEQSIKKDTGKKSVINDDDFLPVFESPTIGAYLNDFIVKGESVASVNGIANAILGPVYQEMLMKNIPTNKFKDLFTTYSNAHKNRLIEEVASIEKESTRARVQRLIDNWDKIENIAKANFGTQVRALEDLVDEDNESMKFDDDKFLTKDVFASSSDRLKMFFAFIPKTTTPILNANRDDSLFLHYYGNVDVWNKITQTLALTANHYIEPRWSIYKTELLNSNLDFAQEFVNRVEKYLDESAKNDLVGTLYNSARTFQLTIRDGSTYNQVSISDKANSGIRKDQWISKFKITDNIKSTEILVNGEIFVEDKTTDSFKERVKDLRKLLKDNTKDYAKLKEILDSLGINLFDKTYDRLKTEWKGDPFGTSRGSLIPSLLLSLDSKNPDINRLFSDNMFTELAIFDMGSSENIYTSTSVSGGKSIQTVGPIRTYELRLSQFINNKLQLSKYWFSKNSIWLGKESLFKYKSVPPEAMRDKDKGTGDLGYDSFGEKEHIIYRLANFNAPSATNVDKTSVDMANYVTGPLEDKKNPFIVTAPRFAIDKDDKARGHNVDGDIYDVMITQLVVPDLLRMIHESPDFMGYNPNNFYLIPELNDVLSLHDSSIFLESVMKSNIESGGLLNVESWFQEGFHEQIKNIIKAQVEQAVNEEKALWSKYNVGSFVPENIKELNNDHPDLGTRNYVINYMLFNANEHIISGDPALFGDKVTNFSKDTVEKALNNKQKRLAYANSAFKHIAEPGVFRLLSIVDPTFQSKNADFLAKYIDNAKYLDKVGSDAQMLTSAENYIDTVFRLGAISNKDMEYLKATVKLQSSDIKKYGKVLKKHMIDEKRLTAILHPLKTVVTSMEYDTTRERLKFIKMSEFPLIPQITQGFEIDKLRQLMENTKVDKIAFSSAFKVGSPTPLNLQIENGSIRLPKNAEDHITTINELNYGEQVENPQDSSYKSLNGSQQTKLKFLNILNETFTYKGKQIKGSELQKIRDKYYEDLFKIKLESLVNELAPDGELDYKKLETILKKEIRDFDPTYAYSLGEDIIKNNIPLWLNPLFKRIQPKLLAIIESRISRTKVHGKGYVQAFSDFFTTSDISKTNIAFTTSFDGELKSTRDENGNIVAAQIIIPWKWAGSMKKYMTNGYIDPLKIPEEILQATGFRIPTSGHNSISRLEIVGFFPKFMGNAILLPSDLMVQMGSDLDFDKLYSLFYNTLQLDNKIVDVREADRIQKVARNIDENSEGIVDTVTESYEEQVIQNELLDIDKAIYLSDSKILRRENHTPIGYGELEYIAGLKTSKKNVSLSVTKQIGKYLAGRVGKAGVGSLSLDNIFHAALQGTDVHFKLYDKSLWQYVSGKEMGEYKLINLDRVHTNSSTKDNVRLISDIYSAYQNVMLDNGKKQLSEPLNITQEGFAFIRGMTQTGHDEYDIDKILTDPLIIRLTNDVQKYSGYFSKYKSQDDILEEYLKKDPNNKVLLQYKTYYLIGKALGSIRAVLNLDSKGFEGSGWSPIIKRKQIGEMITSKSFTNIDNLLRHKDGTMKYSYAAAHHSLEGSKIFYLSKLGNIFPYEFEGIKSAVESVLAGIPEYLKNSTTKEIELRGKIFDEWLKYFYTSFRTRFDITDLGGLRRDLLYDNPLGEKLAKIKDLKDSKLKKNALLANLEVDKRRGLTYVKLLNAQLNGLSSVDLQNSAVELYDQEYPLLEGYTSRDLINDLYKYAYFVSGKQAANEFMKFLPLDYIFTGKLDYKDLLDNTTIPTFDNQVNTFMVQFFQHNPEYASRFEDTDFHFDPGKITKKDSDTRYPPILYREKYDNQTGYTFRSLYFSIDGKEYIQKDVLGNYLFNQYDNAKTTVQTSLLKNVKEEIAAKSTDLDLVKVVNFIQTSLIGKNNPINKFFDKIPLEGIKLVEDPTITRGLYNKPSHTVYLKDRNDFVALAHELVHAVTRSLTDAFYDVNKIDSLTKEQKIILTNIDATFQQMVNDLSPDMRARVEKLRKVKIDGNKFENLTEEDKIPYAFINLQEFMARFTDPNDSAFKQYLRDTYDEPKKNLYQKIRDLFKQLLNTIIGDKSVVDVIEKQIFDLIDSTKEESYFPTLENYREPVNFDEFDTKNSQFLNTFSNIPSRGKDVDSALSSDTNELPLFSKITENTEQIVASEKTIRDLAARLSDRIGIPIKFESDRTKEYKGKIENDIAYINLAYATLDTPIHEILGHPIIRAIKGKYPLTNEYIQSEIDITKKLLNKEITKEEANRLREQRDNPTYSELYKNLLKELEYGKGKEVLDRIKRDYDLTGKYKLVSWEDGYESGRFTSQKSVINEGWKIGDVEIKNGITYYRIPIKYTLEEQQEEAIVELLGLMTAEKLDNVKDGKLISLLKRLLKEIKSFVKDLLKQREVEIDKLPDNMTINDLADLLAYNNNKLILPGYQVTYTTPDNNSFKTYQEASNHISELAKNAKDVDLGNININTEDTVNVKDLNLNTKQKVIDFAERDANYIIDFESLSIEQTPSGIRNLIIKNAKVKDLDFYGNPLETFNIQDVSMIIFGNSYEQLGLQRNYLKDFIDQNKEYEQSKEIIEEWKKVNNIKYNPEEIYSRGQEFSSVVGAYSSFDVNLMMQNLLSHIEDNEKAGGKFAISAFTKPIDKKIGHLEGGGGKIKFKLYPQSEDILWAANTDVYSGSVWDASEKVNKDKQSELLGVSYTKYPSLNNVNSVQPNLSSVVDDLAHHHNELGITVTGNNFRLEYDEDIPYQTKRVIDGINKILDQRYGKLVKPDIKNKQTIYKVYKDNNGVLEHRVNYYTKEEAETYTKALGAGKDKYVIKEELGKPKGIQPTQTNETLKESIDSVKNNVLKQTDYNYTEERKKLTDYNYQIGKQLDSKGYRDKYGNKINNSSFTKEQLQEQEELFKLYKEGVQKLDDFRKSFKPEKEYISQALINTKIAALKEVAKKYPRSLIRSEVVRTKEYYPGEFSGFQEGELPFQKIPSAQRLITKEDVAKLPDCI